MDRELDEEKDVIWGKGHLIKQTKATSKFNSSLTETALHYGIAKKLEKRPIAEKLVAGLSFVHLKDGRVCKELCKDYVVRETMIKLKVKAEDKLNEEAKSQAQLPKITNNYINDNSLELGQIARQLGNIEGKLDLIHDELRSVNKMNAL